MMGKIQRLLSLSLFQFVFYNFFCKNVYRDKHCYILPVRGSRIEFHKTAKLILHGHLYLNINKYPGSNAECYLRLRKRAEMTVNGDVHLFYNATIEVRNGARLSIGKTLVINSGAVILCSYKMTIGSGCLFARSAMILDSDHHRILDDDGNTTNDPEEVIIGDNVWFGINSTVLKGSKIENGSVVGANSLITGTIKEHTLMVNKPPREFSKINWSVKGFEDD